MAVSNQDILNWLNTNAGASDSQIRAAMDTYGVTPQQMASATGTALNDVMSRYEAVSPAALYAETHGMGGDQYAQNIREWINQNPNATTADVAGIKQQYGVSDQDVINAYGSNFLGKPVIQTPANQIPIQSQNPLTPVSPVDARAAQGTLNPTGALESLLSGKVQNPYLDQQSQAIIGQLTRNFSENVLPQIRSGSIASGQYGGSRQGIAEGLAASRLQQDIAVPLYNLYGGAFENAQQRMYGTANTLNQQAVDISNANANRNLQQYGMNQGFYTQQRGQDLQQLGLGASLYNMGNQGYLSQGQGMYDIGNIYQQAPWQTSGNMSQLMQPYTNFGSATVSQPGNWMSGALGGGLLGAQAWRAWNAPSTRSPMTFGEGQY